MALKRRELKKSQFGLPSKRKYPMPDKKHAINAKGRAEQQLKRGKLSRSAYNTIIAKANRVLKTAKAKKTKRKKAAKKTMKTPNAEQSGERIQLDLVGVEGWRAAKTGGPAACGSRPGRPTNTGMCPSCRSAPLRRGIFRRACEESLTGKRLG